MQRRTLLDYISAASKYRCLPNRPQDNNPVALLRFIPLEQLAQAITTPEPAQYLKRTQIKGSVQRALLSHLANSPDAGLSVCQLATLERYASYIPDAFFSQCHALKRCLESYPNHSNVNSLIQFRLALGSPELWKTELMELILAPQVKVETVQFFLNLFEKIAPADSSSSNPSITQLCEELSNGAGPSKTQLAESVGLSASDKQLSTLVEFLRDGLRYNYSEDDVANYELLRALIGETRADDAWIAGTYLYLTSRAAASGFASPLPQLQMHNMLSDLCASLSRLLLCCAVPATFMQRFSSAKVSPVLQQLSTLNSTLDDLSELLAVPRTSTFEQCSQIFASISAGKLSDLWSYKHCNQPWQAGTPVGRRPAGPFGIVSADALFKRLLFSDYSICFELCGMEPSAYRTSELATNPLYKQMKAKAVEPGDPMLERLEYSSNALVQNDLPTPEAESPALDTISTATVIVDDSEGWELSMEGL